MELFKRNDSTERAQKEKCEYDINPKRTPQIGLNRIARKQNVSTLRILQFSFCEERKHLSRSTEFTRSIFSSHEAHFPAVTVRKFLRVQRAPLESGSPL